RIVVWRRILIEDLKHAGAWPDVRGLERLDTSRVQLRHLDRCSAAVGELKEREGSFTQVEARHDSDHRLFASVAASFVIQEEEHSVFDHGAAEGCAEDITNQLGPRYSLGSGRC